MEKEKFRDLAVDSLCRTCLSILDGKQKHDLFKVPELTKKFTLCTSLHVERDGLSRYICYSCLKKLEEFRNFQIMCVDTMHQMQHLIESKIIKSKENMIETELEDLNLNLDLDLKEENDETREDNFLEISRTLDKDEGFNNDELDYSKTEDKIRNKIFSSENKNIFVEQNSGDEKKKVTERFACDKCPKKFYKEYRYSAHKQTHDGLKPYSCSYCDKRFVRHNSLNLHIQYVHDSVGKKFICTEPGCGGSYKREQTLKWHLRKLHNKGPALPEPKKSICELCGKIFKNISSLKKHSFTHNGMELPFGCTLCNKRYVTKHKLKEHTMRHLGEKNYVCSYCGMRKVNGHELKIHMNTHTKAVTYECRICSMKFNSTGNLRRHSKIVHEGIKNYKCQYCERSFGKEETRKHHEMIHTGEKPHKCPICTKSFIQLIAMRMHLKRHKAKEERKKQQENQEELKTL